MKPRHTPANRRTTLTLPADALQQAQRIAKSRRVTLSAVVAEAFDEGLRVHDAAERSREVMDAYRQALTGFSDRELMVLDGIILDPAGR